MTRFAVVQQKEGDKAFNKILYVDFVNVSELLFWCKCTGKGVLIATERQIERLYPPLKQRMDNREMDGVLIVEEGGEGVA